jgi:hypothetical protein
MVAYEMKSPVGRPVVAEIQMEKAAAWKHCSAKMKNQLWINPSTWCPFFLPL